MARFASPTESRLDAPMADNRTISQLEAEGYPWIGCECCKGTVWVPFKMLRERIPMLSAMTLDHLGAKMRCDRLRTTGQSHCQRCPSRCMSDRSSLRFATKRYRKVACDEEWATIIVELFVCGVR